MEQSVAKTFFCQHYDRDVTRAECITLFTEDDFIRKESCIGQSCKSHFVICSACIEQKIKAPKKSSVNGHYFIDYDVENISENNLLCPFHKEKGKDAIFTEKIIPAGTTKKTVKTSNGGEMEKVTEKMAKVYEALKVHCADGEKFDSDISEKIMKSLGMERKDLSNQITLLRIAGLVKNISYGVNQIIYADYEIRERGKRNRKKHVNIKSTALKTSEKKSPVPDISEATPTNNLASLLGLNTKPAAFGEMIDERLNEILETSAVICEEYAKEIRKRKK